MKVWTGAGWKLGARERESFVSKVCQWWGPGQAATFLGSHASQQTFKLNRGEIKTKCKEFLTKNMGRPNEVSDRIMRMSLRFSN